MGLRRLSPRASPSQRRADARLVLVRVFVPFLMFIPALVRTRCGLLNNTHIHTPHTPIVHASKSFTDLFLCSYPSSPSSILLLLDPTYPVMTTIVYIHRIVRPLRPLPDLSCSRVAFHRRFPSLCMYRVFLFLSLPPDFFWFSSVGRIPQRVSTYCALLFAGAYLRSHAAPCARRVVHYQQVLNRNYTASPLGPLRSSLGMACSAPAVSNVVSTSTA